MVKRGWFVGNANITGNASNADELGCRQRREQRLQYFTRARQTSSVIRQPLSESLKKLDLFSFNA